MTNSRKAVGLRLTTLLLVGSAGLPTLMASSLASAAEVATVQEVVVTARHREENLQNIPGTVTAIGGEFLAATNTVGIGQISQMVPSVQFQTINPRNSQINIRGLGNNVGLANDGLDPGVGFYVDGVYYNRPATATFDLIDLERVETLSGPQGTLYGKNTTAGAVSVTTASPSFNFGASGELSAGNYGYVQAKASVTGPIIADRLSGRLSISSTNREGFQTNLYDGKKINNYNNLTARGQILYMPTDDFKVRVIADYSRQHMHCCSAEISGLWNPPSGVNFPALGAKFGYTPVVGRVDVDAAVKANQETGGVSVEADWDLPGAVLTSISAWRYWNWSPASDLLQSRLDDFQKSQVIDRQNQFTQELRIASTGENTVDYVGGVYFFHEKLEAYATTKYGAAAVASVISSALPALILNGVTLSTNSDYKTESYAAFGQATWHLNPKLSLTGGLRYTSDQKKGSYNAVATGGLPLAGPLAGFAAIRSAFASTSGFHVRSNKAAWGGHLDLSYEVNPDVLTYVSYSKGNRSGGLNLNSLPSGASAIVAPESIDAYEAGLKMRLFERRLTLNTSLFFEKDQDYQAQTVDPVLLKTYLANIPEVRSKGFEVSAQGRPSESVSFYASATYDAAIYAKFPTSPCPVEHTLPVPASCNLSGVALPGVPKWAVSGGFEYHRPFSLGTGETQLYFGMDDSYRSSVNSTATVSTYGRLPSRSLINARIGLRSEDRNWDTYVWVKNLLDKDYLTSAQALSPGYIIGFPGDPRTWGVTVRVRR
ncbi:MAG: TonB-dependent receptor [Phenylobacterium zucineum]|nr:MAG: TonB-dependent receptor [Phenylobacterium zucineum]